MTSVPDRPERPSNLVYAVDEWPPPLRLVLLGFQYAVMAAIYLILVVIILRHAKAAQGTGVDAMGIACVGLAIGTALQALPARPRWFRLSRAARVFCCLSCSLSSCRRDRWHAPCFRHDSLRRSG
jgi:xanthine/uracil permease